jgi:hypothetical protein
MARATCKQLRQELTVIKQKKKFFNLAVVQAGQTKNIDEVKKMAEDIRNHLKSIKDLLWFRDVIKDEQLELKNFFGEEIKIPPIPSEITLERVESWKKQGFFLHYLPDMEIPPENNFPGLHKKLSDEFYKMVKQGKIPPDSAFLKSGWFLIDVRDKPNFSLGEAAPEVMYQMDIFSDALLKLRQQGILLGDGMEKGGRTRFKTRPSDLESAEARSCFAEILQVDPKQISLPRAIEYNVIGNMHFPGWDRTTGFEWFSDSLIVDESMRQQAINKYSFMPGRHYLYGGGKFAGGISCCGHESRYKTADNIAFRFMVRFEQD